MDPSLQSNIVLFFFGMSGIKKNPNIACEICMSDIYTEVTTTALIASCTKDKCYRPT